MIRPYRDVLSLPGALPFVVAGLVARLPISMMGIGIVLLVEATRGSYAVAGALSAVYTVTSAAVAPVVARAVDRYGQARVMRPAIAVHVAAILALVALAAAGAPVAALAAAAVVMGASIGSVGALVRTRWTHVVGLAGERVGPRTDTAYSLESVLDEVVFATGPVVVVALSTAVWPGAGLLAAAAAVGIGGAALFAQRATEPPPSATRPAPGSAVMRSSAMVALVVVFTCLGIVFGAVEVAAVAFTDERGVPWAAGPLLAGYAVGSLVAGLAYGAVAWRASAARRFVVAMALLALSLLPVAFVGTVPGLAVALAVAGLAISPSIIAGNSLVRTVVAPGRLTEGLTWVSTALGGGVAAGAALAGVVIDAAGGQRALLVAVAAGAIAALAAVLSGRRLGAAPHAELTAS